MEPWQMTRDEFVAERRAAYAPTKGGRYTKPDTYDHFHETQDRGLHKGRVADALRAGKRVPPQVLRDYPDLAARAAARLEAMNRELGL